MKKTLYLAKSPVGGRLNFGTVSERKVLAMPIDGQHNRDASGKSNREVQQRCPGEPEALGASRKANRDLALGHYENFLVTSVFLPRRFHQAFFDVYAFCRTADDFADESESSEMATQRLKSMERSLDAVFCQTKKVESLSDREGAIHGLFIALADTIDRYQLEREPFSNLLKAFRQDQVKPDYGDDRELLDYCRCSANPVGRIVLGITGANRDETVALSDSICTGLQLVNFLQDIPSDFQRGRIYLPETELKRFEVNAQMLQQNETSEELRQLISQRCEMAEQFLRSGEDLARLVPRWFSPSVKLFAAGGLEVIRMIRRRNYEVLSDRPKVSRAKQFFLLGRAAVRLL